MISNLFCIMITYLTIKNEYLICEKDQRTGNVIVAQRLPDTIRGPKVSTSCFILCKFSTARDRLCEEHKVSASVRLPLTLGILDKCFIW
jgi:hypothetical protein